MAYLYSYIALKPYLPLFFLSLSFLFIIIIIIILNPKLFPFAIIQILIA